MDKKEFKKLLGQQTEEINRHNKVLEESYKSEVKIIAEQHTELVKKIDRNSDIINKLSNNQAKVTTKVDATFEKVGKVSEDMEFVKDELRLIRNELKEKVDRDEFMVLEKRVVFLEKKMKVA